VSNRLFFYFTQKLSQPDQGKKIEPGRAVRFPAAQAATNIPGCVTFGTD
jgi:hypothetical protein